MHRILLVFVLLLTGGCAAISKLGAHPQPQSIPNNTHQIDLAVLPIDSQSIHVGPGDHYVRIVNLAPASTYAISAQLETTDLPLLELPASTKADTVIRTNRVSVSTTGCVMLNTSLDGLAAATEEVTVPPLITSVHAGIADTTCRDTAFKSEARRQIEGTERLLGPFHVRQGQALHVRIVRSGGTPRWARSYMTGDRGRWVSTYGFNFIWTGFSPNRRYFLEETATAGTYQITSARSKEHFELAPSLFYTWMPGNAGVRDLTWSPTVGLGFDFEAPVVSVGLAGTYNQNAVLSVGLSLHQVRRLSERYAVGEQVTTLIGDEDLFRNVYRVNPYVAVSIRSLSNPFQRDAGGN